MPWWRFVKRLLANMVLILFTFCLFYMAYSIRNNYRKTIYFMKSINEVKYSLIYESQFGGSNANATVESYFLPSLELPTSTSDSNEWHKRPYAAAAGNRVHLPLYRRKYLINNNRPSRRYGKYCRSQGYTDGRRSNECIRKLNSIKFTVPTKGSESSVQYSEKGFFVKKRPRVILFWSEKIKLPFVKHTFKRCNVKDCVMVPNDPFYYPYVDAVLFIIKNQKRRKHLPKDWRRSHQKWIFYNREPPVNLNIDLAALDDFFNWTMSYRRDSDVHIPWGMTVKRGSDEELINAPESLNSKEVDYDEAVGGRVSEALVHKANQIMDARACWFVSHCKTQSQREQVARELARNIPLDVYGTCGTLECPRKPRSLCRAVIERDYKFYLSFENSLCREYVTEKVFDILKLDIIPVVYGATNYTAILPPHSFVQVTDFPSISSLAKYLLYLDSSPPEYLAYFEWRRWYRILIPDPFCRLCERLNDPKVAEDADTNEVEMYKKQYPDFKGWWQGPKHEPMCRPARVMGDRVFEMNAT